MVLMADYLYELRDMLMGILLLACRFGRMDWPTAGTMQRVDACLLGGLGE